MEAQALMQRLVELSVREGDTAALEYLLCGGELIDYDEGFERRLELCLAAGRGDMETVYRSLHLGDLEVLNASILKRGGTALMFAAANGQDQTAEALCSHPGLQPLTTTSKGLTALSLACSSECRKMLAHVLIQHSSDDGGQAVVQAACLRDDKSLKALLDAKADADAVDGQGRPALLIAALRGNVKACELLLGSGAYLAPPPTGAPSPTAPRTAALWQIPNEQLQLVLKLYVDSNE